MKIAIHITDKILISNEHSLIFNKKHEHDSMNNLKFAFNAMNFLDIFYRQQLTDSDIIEVHSTSDAS